MTPPHSLHCHHFKPPHDSNDLHLLETRRFNADYIAIRLYVQAIAQRDDALAACAAAVEELAATREMHEMQLAAAEGELGALRSVVEAQSVEGETQLAGINAKLSERDTQLTGVNAQLCVLTHELEAAHATAGATAEVHERERAELVEAHCANVTKLRDALEAAVADAATAAKGAGAAEAAEAAERRLEALQGAHTQGLADVLARLSRDADDHAAQLEHHARAHAAELHRVKAASEEALTRAQLDADEAAETVSMAHAAIAEAEGELSKHIRAQETSVAKMRAEIVRGAEERVERLVSDQTKAAQAAADAAQLALNNARSSHAEVGGCRGMELGSV